MTWNELKTFCNSLDEKQLEHNVIMWREDDVINDISAMQLDEDHYVDNEGDFEDGCFPQSEAEAMIRDNEPDFPNGMEHFQKVYDKGHPLLAENF
jgi:hypothetical protein